VTIYRMGHEKVAQQQLPEVMTPVTIYRMGHEKVAQQQLPEVIAPM